MTERRRRILSLATAATLALGLPVVGTSLLAGPAQSADPVSDCVQPFPVGELAAGDLVDGLTVTQGTTPTGFTGEVLGILEDGIAPDVDMVMVDLEMPEFARTGGVWQGMSGSPVYAADGRLIGAVAYGLAWGPSPIAGVTPFADMDDYLAAGAAPGAAPGGATGATSTRTPLDATDARTVAARAGISTAEASRGFRELPMPMGITGIAARRLAQLQVEGPDFVERSSYVMGRASAADAGPETVVAGGNIGASVAHGDVSMAGVGTATSVCDGRVVGFGHPLAFLGSTSEGLHPADAVFVQPDSLGAPFKVANLAPPAGTVTDDRLTGITGTFGAPPSAIDLTSQVTYGARSRTGTTAVSVPEFAAEATFYQLIANQDRVVDGPSKGSELLTWRIEGTERGKAFTLSFTDRWTGTDLVFEPSYGIADLVGYVGSLDGVTVSSVLAQATVVDDLARHTLVAVEQRRGDRWVRVTDKAPAVGRAGRKIWLRVVLGGSAGTQRRWLTPVALPQRAKGTELALIAQGGDGLYSETSGDTVARLRASLAQQLRHDQVRVQIGTQDKVDPGFGEEYEFMRPRRFSFLRTQTLGPLAHVVTGTRSLSVVVR